MDKNIIMFYLFCYFSSNFNALCKMIGLTKLTPKQIEVLREMCLFKCQETGKHEDEVGKLQPHRLVRGNVGGKYVPFNIKMICKESHKLYHGNEFSNCQSN